MNLFDAIKTELSKQTTLTENGAVAYRTSGKAITDFNFEITALRHAAVSKVLAEWIKVYTEDPVLAVKYLFYVGDVRQGLGERRIFKICFAWLAVNYTKDAKKLLQLISEYTRYDILTELILVDELRTDVVKLVTEQLTADIMNMTSLKPISLLAKWMPSENTSSKETVALAKLWIKALDVTPKKYRKMLAGLRSYLDVVEVKTSSNNWSDINYEAVPSMANLKYEIAFLKHDYERRNEYLDSLKNGATKINASVASPVDIVNRYKGYWNTNDTLEEMWKALPVINSNDMLVVRDGSGSMTCGRSIAPLTVANALSIYTSEHNTGIWKDKFITFSSRPELVDMSKLTSLGDKLEFLNYYDDCSNTNLEATFDLILNAAIENNLSQEDLPKNILIISDMQFDGAVSRLAEEALMNTIINKFNEAGYQMPKLIFWNVAQDINKTIPLQENKAGVILVSGYSPAVLNLVTSGELDPYKALIKVVNSERYQQVEDLLIKK